MAPKKGGKGKSGGAPATAKPVAPVAAPAASSSSGSGSGGGGASDGKGEAAGIEQALSALTAASAAKHSLELEKKTKPIYDALDVRNYKQALKLLAAAQQKFGDAPILLTLKAIALERTGKRDEALGLCKVVQDTHPTDSKLLNALTIVYKLTDMAHESTVCYENAFRKDPTNQDMALMLYFAHGRESAFAKQQTHAMVLYKNFKDVKYLFWSALCMLIQTRGTSATGAAAVNKLLAVAEMMIARTIAARPTVALDAEHFLIYLRLVVQQGKYAQALALLDSPYAQLYGKEPPTGPPSTASASSSGDATGLEKDAKERDLSMTGYYFIPDRRRTEAELYSKLKLFGKAVDCFHELLTHTQYGNADDWALWNGYFDAAFAHMAGQQASANSAVASVPATPTAAAGAAAADVKDSKSVAAAVDAAPASGAVSVDSLRAFVARLQAAEAKTGVPARRGPFLSELELERRLINAQLVSSGDHLRSLILSYYRRYSNRQCFFWDVQPYLDLLLASPPAAEHALHLSTAVGPLASAMDDAPKPTAAAAASPSPDGERPASANGSAAAAAAAAALPAAPSPAPTAPKGGFAENRLRRTISAYQLQRYCGHLPLSLRLHDSSGRRVQTANTDVDAKGVMRWATGSAAAADGKSAAAPVDDKKAREEATASLVALARQLFDEFLAAQRLAKNLEPTERSEGDVLLQMAAHVLLELHDRTGTRSYLCDAIAALELGLQKFSKFNFQFKLLLTRLYCHPAIGAVHAAYAHYKSLGVRFIQEDTLSHLITDDLLRYGAVSTLADSGVVAAHGVVNFHRTHAREGPEMLTMAYRTGAYSKVLEFVELNDRLARSYTAMATRLQLLHAQLAALAPAAVGADSPFDAAAVRKHALNLLTSDLLDDRVPEPVAAAASAGTAASSATPTSAASVAAAVASNAAALTGADLSAADRVADIPFELLSCNVDFGIVSCWDPPAQLTSARLNRPTAAIDCSSLDVPNGQGLERRTGQVGSDGKATYEISEHTRAVTRLRHFSMVALKCILQGKIARSRAALLKFRTALTDLKLTDFHTATAPPPPSSAAPLSFDAQHWRLAFTVLEMGATINECAAAAEPLLTGKSAASGAAAVAAADGKSPAPSAPATPSASDRKLGGVEGHNAALKDVSSRCEQVKAGLTAISAMVDALETHLTANTLLLSTGSGSAAGDGPLTEARRMLQIEKDALNPTFNPRAVVQYSVYLTHAIRWLSLMLPIWETQFPSKKAFRKAHRPTGSDAAAAEQQTFWSDSVLDVFATVRTVLKATTDALFASLQRSVLLLTKYKSAREKSNAAGEPAAAPRATSVFRLFDAAAAPAPADQKGGATAAAGEVVSAADAQDVYRRMSTSIESSVRTSVGHIVALLQNAQSPIDTIKFG